MTGKRSLYEVNGGTKVAELMLMIQDRDGINPELYRLIWAARVMEDDKTLSDYNLQNLQVLQLVMRHKGGARTSIGLYYRLCEALWVDVIIVAEGVQDSVSGLVDAYQCIGSLVAQGVGALLHTRTMAEDCSSDEPLIMPGYILPFFLCKRRRAPKAQTQTPRHNIGESHQAESPESKPQALEEELSVVGVRGKERIEREITDMQITLQCKREEQTKLESQAADLRNTIERERARARERELDLLHKIEEEKAQPRLVQDRNEKMRKQIADEHIQVNGHKEIQAKAEAEIRQYEEIQAKAEAEIRRHREIQAKAEAETRQVQAEHKRRMAIIKSVHEYRMAAADRQIAESELKIAELELKPLKRARALADKASPSEKLRGRLREKLDGMQSASPLSGESVLDAASEEPASDEEAESTCVVCFERESTWLFESCRHLCLCRPCARKLNSHSDRSSCSAQRRRNPKPCPLCRTTSRLIHVSKLSESSM